MTREDKLLKKLEYGDMSALDELISLYYADILRYCICHTKDRQTAEDAVQETFLKTVRYLDRYVHKGKFRAFFIPGGSQYVCRYVEKKTPGGTDTGHSGMPGAWIFKGRDRDGFYTFDQRTVQRAERDHISSLCP